MYILSQRQIDELIEAIIINLHKLFNYDEVPKFINDDIVDNDDNNNILNGGD